MNNNEIDANELRRMIDPSEINTDNIRGDQPRNSMIGQDRVTKALAFGIGNKSFGFNVYVSGYPVMGTLKAVKDFIQKKSAEQKPPSDWCYVNNFKDSYYPKVLKLPAGKAKKFKNDMQNFIQDIRKALNEAFEGNEYQNQKEELVKSSEQKKKELFLSLSEKAKAEGFEIQQTPFGIATVPLNRKGEPFNSEEFGKLDKSRQQEILDKQENFKEEVKTDLRISRNFEKEAGEKVKRLDRKVAEHAINPLIEEMEEQYHEEDDVKTYLEEVKNDIIENFSDFFEKDKKEQQTIAIFQVQQQPSLKRYEVNVFIDNSELKGAPLIHELNPTYNGLFGKVEKESHMGMLTTDFTLIKSGSLHRANGGYLIISVIELLKNPYSWDSLKKALQSREIKIEEISEKLGFVSTKSLSPQPIPLDIQIILLGQPDFYHLLYAYDIDFRNLFKVKAEFDTTLELNDANINNYLSYITSIQKEENLHLFDKSGFAKILEYSCRLAEDKNKLSARFTEVYDIIAEADYYCHSDGNERINADHIKEAIEEKFYRSNLIQEKYKEMFENNMLIIDVEGDKVGQVNGLAIIDLLDFSFGKPNRITVTTGVGSEGIIDIEREAKLGGNIHSKGIMILAGYLSENYARNKPIGLSARIVFEQSYQGVEGDSASCAELYALLSSLSGLPIKQGIAVTGSVNQKGEVQAVGGINDKIEGYFEVCKIIGLTGKQGVIIPQSNTRSLMLKEEVVEAVKTGNFHIWAVNNINEGISILTGIDAGLRNESGKFEENSVNARVDEAIEKLAKQMKSFISGKES